MSVIREDRTNWSVLEKRKHFKEHTRAVVHVLPAVRESHARKRKRKRERERYSILLVSRLCELFSLVLRNLLSCTLFSAYDEGETFKLSHLDFPVFRPFDDARLTEPSFFFLSIFGRFVRLVSVILVDCFSVFGNICAICIN